MDIQIDGDTPNKIEEIYNETFVRGKTFCNDIVDIIESEKKRIYEEWKKKNCNNSTD